MTLDQLKMFIAVVETKTFSGAAKKLFISQPSITVAIRNLESELKISLFDRGHYRPRLTDEGLEIYQRAKQLVELAQELKVSAELRAKGEESRLKIILDVVAPLPHILKVLRTYFSQQKSCKLELSFCVLGSGLRNVVANEADLYIGPVFEEREDISTSFFAHYFMIPVLSSCHEFARLPMREMARRIKEVPRVILRSSAQQKSQDVGDNWQDERAILVEDHLIKKETIQAGLGWGRLPLWNIEAELKQKLLIDMRKAFPAMKIQGDIFLVPKATNRGKHLHAVLAALQRLAKIPE